MEPALHPGDWRVAPPPRRIRPGQIVIARHPGRPDMLLVKRALRPAGGRWWLLSDNPAAGAVGSRRFGAGPGSGPVLGVPAKRAEINPREKTTAPAGQTGPFATSYSTQW